MNDTGTISAERKALDLVIQASRADPKLRAAVLEVEKWLDALLADNERLKADKISLMRRVAKARRDVSP